MAARPLVLLGFLLLGCGRGDPTLVVRVSALPPSASALRVQVHVEKVPARDPLDVPLGALAGAEAASFGLRLPAEASGRPLALGVAALDPQGRFVAVGSQAEDSLVVRGGIQGEQQIAVALTTVNPTSQGTPPLLLYADPPQLSSLGRDSAGQEQRLRVLGWGLDPGAEIRVAGRQARRVTWRSGVELLADVPTEPDLLGPVLLSIRTAAGRRESRPDLFSYFAETLDFVAERHLLSPGFPLGRLAVADFNEDGHPDLLGVGTSFASVWRGTGSSGLLYPLNTPTLGPGGLASETILAVADVTGDRHTDAVIRCGDKLCVLPGVGDGTFEPPLLQDSGTPDAVAVSDFDRDGIVDLAVHRASTKDIAVLFGEGQGRFSAASQLPIPGPLGSPSIDRFVVADVNQDGRPDLVTGRYLFDCSVTVYLASGLKRGDFYQTSSSTQRFPCQPPFELAVDDFSGDRRPEILVSYLGGYVLLSLNSLFELERPLAAVLADAKVQAVDVNLDERTDLVITQRTLGRDSSRLLLNIAGEGLRPVASFPKYLPLIGSLAAVGDLDEDGFPELLLLDHDSVNIISGGPMGRYRTAADHVPEAVGSSVSQFIAADFVGSGYPGILALGSAGASLLLNHGDGTFQGGKPLPGLKAVGSEQSVLAADFNGDGKLDVADLALQRWGEMSLNVYFGSGTGEFAAPIFTRVDVRNLRLDSLVRDSISATAADVDGDGRPDVLISDGPQLQILLGRGDGSFEPPSYYEWEHLVTRFTAADLNHDQRADLIAVDEDSSTATVLLAKKGGSLGARLEVPLGLRARYVEVADFDKDRHPDLLVADARARTAVLLGNGRGGFSAPRVRIVPVTIEGLAAADLNGDGLVDVAVWGHEANLQLVNRGAGLLEPLGSLQSSCGSTLLRSYRIFQALDLNGDRLADLVCRNENLRVVLNASR